MLQKPITLLRITGFFDGMSLLILLAIAMPLKYAGGVDIAVTIAGSIHGVIFMAYVLAIAYAALRVKWNIKWSLAGLVVAVIPFGNFVYDRKLKVAEATYGMK
ncbi:DUF3817 domain-containing protein [Paenibacillus yanchengensis]|uniref:DUF3817 domain-containing protein n=1 Tax=Paenibacillus yanchengensis TaxID=2035833 RepID=A0ABW4YQS6_9BACL